MAGWKKGRREGSANPWVNPEQALGKSFRIGTCPDDERADVGEAVGVLQARDERRSTEPRR